jgi:uncharacterized membrane protein
MGTGRLEAFSDGVIAIIVAIIVLELKALKNDAHSHRRLPLRPRSIRGHCADGHRSR